MMNTLQEWLATTGLNESYLAATATAVAFAVLLLVSVIAYYLTHALVSRVLRAVVKRTASDWDDALVEARLFRRLAHLVPALVLLQGNRLIVDGFPGAMATLESLISSYLVLIAVLVVNALLNAALEIYERGDVSRRFQIKTVVQVIQLLVFFFGGIAILAMLMGRSPLVLVSGLGAFTAVLMLVFRDAILGFVAGIQLSANNMVRVGDWIEMPSQGADGDVVDVSLTTVKVQNWDKTISTIPTYALVSDSFKNWRGMSESGGRRIKRALHIDVNSVRFCDEEMLERFLKIQYIQNYVEKTHGEATRYNAEHGFDTTLLVNGRHLTNVGTFRAYIEAYLRNHPMIHQEMTLLVRQLAPSEKGLPIEIYVFSRDQDWARYEAIQADIFDHLLAVAPLFDLRIFQAPTGTDLRALGEQVAASVERRGDCSVAGCG